MPSVSAVSPTSGGTGGGAVLTVTGSGFTLATGVSFGNYPASFTVNSDTQLTAVAPAQAAGTVHVTVTNAAGTSSTSASDQFTYNAAAAPAVTGVSPSAGPLAGGNWVLVSGSGFTGATGVTFGSASAPGFGVVSDTSLFAQAPAGSAGVVDVKVTTPSGTSAVVTADRYTYQAAPSVTSITPNSDTTSGGLSVVLTGSNLTGTTAIYFGDFAAPSFTVTSDTSITATTPAQSSAGSVNVVVVAPGGFSSPVSFLYLQGGGGRPPGGQPQFLAGNPRPPAAGSADLTQGQLHPVVTRAVADLAAAGFDVSGLGRVEFDVADLSGSLLGLTFRNTIWIDPNAAGYGWYVDASPGSDAAFTRVTGANERRAEPGSPAYGHVDLLTVVTHELGHVLGFASIDPGMLGHDWMTATLGTGVRRYPDAAGGMRVTPEVGLRQVAAFSNGTPGLAPRPDEGSGLVAVGQGGAHAGKPLTAAHPPVPGNGSATPAEGELTDAAGAITQVLLGTGGPRLVADRNRRQDDPAAVTGRDAAVAQELVGFRGRADWGQGPVAVFPPREQPPGRAGLFAGVALLDRVFEAGLDQGQDPWVVTDWR